MTVEMASVAVDVANMTQHGGALEAVMAAAASSAASTPCTSAVFSTSSTAALSLSGFSRQNSDMSQLHDDPLASSVVPDDTRPGIHRVASEQLLPRTNDLSQSATPAVARASSMIVGKVTSRRRQRNPRRFVVTELPPEQDEFLSETSPPRDVERQQSTHSTASDGQPAAAPTTDAAASASAATPADGADALVTPPPAAPQRTYRPAKMEVRGRFTIIDLSPDSPESSALDDPSPAMEHVELSRSVRAGGQNGNSTTSVRRRQPPRRSSRSEKTMSASTPTAASSSSRAMPESSVLTAAMLQDAHTARYTSHEDSSHHNGSSYSRAPPQSPLRVDLSALDRHLVFLQQESHDMKALLESMISSNARWITALASSPDSNIGSGKNPKAVHPATSPTMQSHAVPVVVPAPEPTLEQKYDRLQQAHNDLQAKYDELLRESSQLQRNNIMLETRLRQETSVNEELRIHVDQLTQYTESLILGAEVPSTAEPQRRQESLSSSSTEVLLPEHDASELMLPPAPQSLTRRSKPSTPVLQPHYNHHQRTISDFSVDSAALWMMDNNQSGLEDDDESNVDDSDMDATTARNIAIAKARRRRWRNMSRSASMSMEEDSASSVYSSSYRDSWVSHFDPQLMNFDGASEDDSNPLFEMPKSRKVRMDSSDSSLLLVESANNQTEDEATDADNDVQLPAFWLKRRKSSAMIVEELEHEVATPSKPAVE